MAHIISSHNVSTQSVTESAPTSNDGLPHDELWRALKEQRTRLLNSSNLSLTTGEEPELTSDVADQAAIECEQDLAMQVKSRTFDKLRRIERAMQLIRTAGYGRCRRCQAEIPAKRLKVQPEALFCVPCLTIVEQQTVGA